MRRFIMLAAALALSLVTTNALGADPLKVGFIYVGPIGDHGWSYQHDQGRLAVEKAWGKGVKTLYIEKVTEGPDTERAITRLAREGAGLIFTTSFGFMDPTIKVAKRFPKVKFEHATGFKRAKNVSTYSSRFYEGRYVIGQIAAKAAELDGWLDHVLATYSILPVDAIAFKEWARLMHRQSDTLMQDALIAAVAIANRLTIVTRNIRDFQDMNVSILNPFNDPPTVQDREEHWAR